MIKKAFFGLLFFFILPVFSFFQISLSAQTVTPVVAKNSTTLIETPFCFTAVRCDSKNAGCVGNHVAVHTAKLTIDSTDKPQPNSKVYIMDCLSASDGLHCTTGFQTLNDYLGYPPMPSGLGYATYGNYTLYKQDGSTGIDQTTNTLITNSQAQLEYGDASPVSFLEWTDHSKDTDRQWIGISVSQPTPTSAPVLGMGAVQQATIPALDWTSALQKCVPINWDPDGIVFDSQSLEPIPNASVTLTEKRSNGSFSLVTANDAPGGDIVNPFLTLEDGGFSFFVPDGTYQLTPQIVGYKFPSALTLNINYSKVYSDIYPALSIGGVNIVEKGGPQHRDIPVDSATGQPTHFPIKFMSYSYQSDKVSSVFLTGRVSHPLATINAYSDVPDSSNSGAMIRYKLVTTVQADNLGRFSLVINQATFDSSKGEMFGEVEATKADFGVSGNDQNSAPALLKLNPIPTYLQGQASANGKALPGATVSIAYDGGTTPIYSTTADSQGNFTIPSDYIPMLPYKLRYTSGGVTTSLTTANFVAENETSTTGSTTIANNKVNLFYPQYSDPAVNNSIKKSIAAYNAQIKNKQNGLTAGTTGQNGLTGGNQGGGMAGVGGSSGGVNGKGSSTSQASASKTMTFVVIVLLIIIVLGGVGAAGVYFIKKSQNVQNPPVV